MKRILFFVTVLCVAGCASRHEETGGSIVRVETMLAGLSNDTTAGIYVGTVEQEQSASLSFPMGGTIAEISTDEGRYVRKGDLLAQLDDSSARQTYAAAAATLEQAEDAVERLKRLHDANSLPEIQWVEAQTKLSQARAAYSIAKKNLDDCSLRTPFDGVVGKRMATVGETAVPGAPVMTVLGIETVKIRFAVPEGEIVDLKADDSISVSVAALGGKVFRGGDMDKSAVANAAVHSYDVRVSVRNRDRELLPGMVCRVERYPAGERPQIAVPARAVSRSDSGDTFVWVVGADSAAVRRPIEVGGLVDNRIVVVSGLECGDRVVTEGMQKVGEGTKVVW